PDEDFAETFAVVIAPESRWRERYQGWPVALGKLRFVDGLVRHFGARRPRVVAGPRCFVAGRMRKTLGSYYAQRIKDAGFHHPAYFDDELAAIFSRPGAAFRHRGKRRASDYLRKHGALLA